MITKDTIVALATPSGSGAIATIRVSGEDAIRLTATVFQAKNKVCLLTQKSRTLQPDSALFRSFKARFQFLWSSFF